MSFLPVGNPFPVETPASPTCVGRSASTSPPDPPSPDHDICPSLRSLMVNARKAIPPPSFTSPNPLSDRTNQASAPPSDDLSGPSSGDKHPRDEDDDGGREKDIPLDEPTLTAIAKHILGIKRMRPENKALFEQSLRSSREERAALNTAFTIWTYEAISLQSEDWKIDGTLEKTIKRYAYAYIYAPGITSYKVGANVQVMSLLKRSHPALMPPDTEPVRLEKVAAVVKRELTNARSNLKLAVKSAIERSTTPAKDKSNSADKATDVATVCSQLLKKGGPQIRFTVQHYARVAFIRWALVEFAKVAEGQFWTKVDSHLGEMRQGLNPEQRHSVFKQILTADNEKYGQPAHHNTQLSAAKDLETWQVSCERAAEKALETSGGSVAEED